MRRATGIGICLLLASGLAWSNTFKLDSTGFSSGGSLLIQGSKDGNFTIVQVPSGPVNASAYVTFGSNGALSTFPFTSGAWLHDTGSSEWISPKIFETSSDAVGEYIYQETFDLTGLNLATVVIDGQWSADNYGNMVVNGTAVTGPTNGAIANQPGQFKSFTSFVLNSLDANFVQGLNTIQFDVYNNNVGSPDVTGINVDIESTFADPVPEPASCLLTGLGLAALALGARRSRGRSRPRADYFVNPCT